MIVETLIAALDGIAAACDRLATRLDNWLLRRYCDGTAPE